MIIKTFQKHYVLDTNIILEDANQIFKLSDNNENLIVIPETVIDELDVKKVGFDEINFQAREFGRILSEAKIVGTTKKSQASIMRLFVNDTTIDIVSLNNYDTSNIEKSIVNDRKILQVGVFAKKYYSNSILLSNDVMCRLRAYSLGLETEGIYQNRESVGPEFIKEISDLDPQLLLQSNGISVLTIDPNWKPENYCYHLMATNGNQRIAYVTDGVLKFIKDDAFDGLLIKPLNMGQKFATVGMLDENINVCLVEALAGSGKTLLAVSAGMKMVKDGKYDKIIYIRNSVDSTDKAEQVGFLSGNEEKFEVYNYPLMDTLEFIAQKEIKSKSKEYRPDQITTKVKELIKTYNIETMWNGSNRGRTISRAYVIIDEVQNFAKTSLRTALSRLDEECKVVCIGSNRQIDHPYINKHTNGLSTLLKAAKEGNQEINVFGTELNKVVRGKITAWTERIFD